MDIREWIGVGGLGFLFLLLALRIPVALAMFLVALVGSFVLSLATPFLRFDAYLLQFQSSFWNSPVASYELSVYFDGSFCNQDCQRTSSFSKCKHW